MNVFKLKTVALFAIALCLIFSCVKEKKAAAFPPENAVYRIAVDSYPPYSYPVEGSDYGKYGGFEVEVLEKIAESENFSYKLIPLPFAEALKSLEDGQVDAVVSVLKTKEREKIYDFSLSTIDTGMIFAANAGDESVNSMKDLNSKRVAAQKGSIGETVALSLKNEYNFEVVVFDYVAFCEEDVKEELSAALANDYRIILNNDKFFKPISEIYMPSENAFAVLKGHNGELLAKLDRGISKLKLSGSLPEIERKYFKSEL